MNKSSYSYSFKIIFASILLMSGLLSCKKDKTLDAPVYSDGILTYTVDESFNSSNSYKVNGVNPTIILSFSEAIENNEIHKISFKKVSGNVIGFTSTSNDGQKTFVISPTIDLDPFSNYQIIIPNGLITAAGGKILNSPTISISTGLDNKDKFPQISDNDLLTLIQKQTFKYFWDFGHPNSGLARERNTSGDVVTTGGSGFGVMSIVVGVNRNFVTRSEALARLQKIVDFLKTADTFHGAFPHWLNGNTGKVQPFSAKDNGADLVETSLLLQGLLVARQYFDGADATETQLRTDINQIYKNVDWNWFRKSNENQLYWHWSPNYEFDINLKIKGWNESLIVYVLAASSPTHTIPKLVYDNGWADNGAIKNGNSYYGITLPLGPANGGPLFLDHYSFLGLNPFGLKDAYADYQQQVTAHTKINYNYCVANPKGFAGYSKNCWGLSASDINGGYTASSPNNDRGYIAPTAAISSIAFAPEESLAAIRFFYYKLGDKMWGEYGFKDAFSLSDPWFASSYLAIDQGPQIVMIENYRSGLIWDLFMSCPEVKTGLIKLGFQSPKI
ncbi:MAG TPA: glucoamylase family protein [Pelobium sp.]|nr:glucoamylase family protein [Pelobium sp.]